MRSWLRGKRGGAAALLAITALVAGGLGWVTAASLRLEQEHLQAQARADLQARLQLALSLLDGRVRPVLAREDSRPYNHYNPLYVSSQALTADGNPYPPGVVLEPSPLLAAELPDWVLVHFQVDEEGHWGSPEVPSLPVRRELARAGVKVPSGAETAPRYRLLQALRAEFPPRDLLATARQHGAEPTVKDLASLPAAPDGNTFGNFSALRNNEVQQMPPQQAIDPGYVRRAYQGQRLAEENRSANPKDSLQTANANTSPGGDPIPNLLAPGAPPSEQVEVLLSPMVPLWLKGAGGNEQLALARVVRVKDRQVCQGVALDAARLQTLLAAEVGDLFPDARVLPVHDQDAADPERTARTMTALPFELDPGPAALAVAPAGWTPLRVGLCLAWAAALLALLAVGLGGAFLLDFSERRLRFVSAVTHELRTPLTTLRLYLDMLTGGLVREEGQREEYLRTLHAEADRLSRLVGNVLDFSRLESGRPRLVRGRVDPGELLEQVRATWQGRCHDAGKELVMENGLGPGAVVDTDGELVQQVLGTLIDNACKYSRGASDDHVWLRARREGPRLLLEVEDRGPGVAPAERRAIFRPFRRGGQAETTGGVGLGLALARRWARLLGGRLRLWPGQGGGACFRLELPLPPGLPDGAPCP